MLKLFIALHKMIERMIILGRGSILLVSIEVTEDLSDLFVIMCSITGIHSQTCTGRCPCGVMVEEMNFGIIVSEFELQLCYYIHFQTNTLGKGMMPLILPAMGQIVPQLFF